MVLFGESTHDLGQYEPFVRWAHQGKCTMPTSRLVLAALRVWLAERPESRPRRVVARYALERAVKESPALRALYE